MAQIADVLLLGGLGAVGAYFTNFMGFRDWFDVQVTGGPSQIYQPEPQPQPKPAPFSAGKSGNCTWDTKGGWCWASTACGKPCKTCVTGVKTTNVADGCGRARSDFIKRAGGCPGCKGGTTTPPKPKPVGPCYGPCPLGKRAAIVGGSCGCVNCTNTCTACYDRVSNCGCKLNESKIIHKDTNCSIGCNGYACWTNYPCASKGARAQKCVKSASCTAARSAWLAVYGCKSSFAYVRRFN